MVEELVGQRVDRRGRALAAVTVGVVLVGGAGLAVALTGTAEATPGAPPVSCAGSSI